MKERLKITESDGPGDESLIAGLAEEIWTEHYTPLIGAEQVKYMIDRFQSAEAIATQIRENGYHYFYTLLDGIPAGYCAVVPKPEEWSVFLSKLYVAAPYRKMGIARAMLEAALKASCAGCGLAWLTVNKHNAGSIEAYKKLGFRITDEMVTDIGGGFVMDDYKMEMDI